MRHLVSRPVSDRQVAIDGSTCQCGSMQCMSVATSISDDMLSSAIDRWVLDIVTVCRRQSVGVSIDQRMRCKHSPHPLDPNDGQHAVTVNRCQQLVPLSARCCRGGIRRGTDSRYRLFADPFESVIPDSLLPFRISLLLVVGGAPATPHLDFDPRGVWLHFRCPFFGPCGT